ncbi:MAG: MerR family transcriptional regulator, partial [Bacilli bacterium]|nr:MerR family transcriptional regulator [Bacilli bacterium]
MTIKDAEKITGLTNKSIRYYEEKGLIKVERNTENDYRNYTEEDIERLKLIKILRYIDFSVDEITAVFKSENLKDSLKDKLKQLEKEKDTYLEKQTICNSLLKDYKKKQFKKVVDDYCETINFLDSSEGEELRENILDILCPNLSSMLIQTLIFLAPIISLFINIYSKRWSAMFTNSILALLSACFLTTEWSHYL